MYTINWLDRQSPGQMQRIAEFLDQIEGTCQGSCNRESLMAAFASCMTELSNREKLTGGVLEAWMRNFLPSAKLDESIKNNLKKVAEHFNQILSRLNLLSSDSSYLNGIVDCIWFIEYQTDLPKAKVSLAQLLAAGIAERCHRPIPIFPSQQDKEHELALKNKDTLKEYLRDIIRHSVYGMENEGVPLKEIERDGMNSIYTSPAGEKLIVQWHDLYQDEWKEFLKRSA